MIRKAAVVLLILSGFSPAAFGGGFEVHVVPSGHLYAQEARSVGIGYQGSSPYYDFVLQTIYFVNLTDAALTLEGGSIELLAGDTVVQTTLISTAEMLRAQARAAAIQQMNFPAALDVDYQAGSALPEGCGLSPTLTLEPGTAGLVDDYYQILRSLPDEVRVTGWARDAAGERVTGVTTIPVRVHEARNTYTFPLEPGESFVLAFPGLRGHHRWSTATEHGYDITMVDSRGSWASGHVADWRTGRVPRWEDWYAYDKKVLAAADGVVVNVVDDVEFPLEFWNRGDAESLEEYRGRIGQKQMELFMEPGADPAAVAGGNYIVIRHPGDEYSFYAHLAYGSIRVEEGQEVRQGEHIAGLGGTGEEPAVHLHFQVSDGPSMLTSRTLPVEFTGVHVNEQFSDIFEPRLVFQPGFFVTSSGLDE
jgi:murein DD-endopeptidase MepM/ murein hydrolase activator NlpD